MSEQVLPATNGWCQSCGCFPLPLGDKICEKCANPKPKFRKKPKLRTERWHSSEAREEVHYFIAGTQVYVAGFNPGFFSDDEMKSVLRQAGFDI